MGEALVWNSDLIEKVGHLDHVDKVVLYLCQVKNQMHRCLSGSEFLPPPAVFQHFPDDLSVRNRLIKASNYVSFQDQNTLHLDIPV